MAISGFPRDTTAPLPAAGLARRLGAMLYDSLLLFAITWSVTAIGVALRVARLGEQPIRASGEAALQGPALQIALGGAVLLFFGWFWTRSGQTLGMQAWRLRVQGAAGGRISWRQALLRMAGAVLSAACLGAGYLWILVDREHLAWHDRISGTRVVLLPANRERER